jgi:hypothetical protein
VTGSMDDRPSGCVIYLHDGGNQPIYRPAPELESILAVDPFKSMKVTPDMRLCVVFAAINPDELPKNPGMCSERKEAPIGRENPY